MKNAAILASKINRHNGRLSITYEFCGEGCPWSINYFSESFAICGRDKSRGVSPSGFVSTSDRKGFGKVVDVTWTTLAAKLQRDAQETVVPI